MSNVFCRLPLNSTSVVSKTFIRFLNFLDMYRVAKQSTKLKNLFLEAGRWIHTDGLEKVPNS